MPAVTPSGADNIEIEPLALIADGANTAAEAATVAAAGAGGAVGAAAGALGGAGDIQRPPGVAAQMAIAEHWPSISESHIQSVAD
ncbi:hypothetical protein RBA10_22595, partial [Mycobacteroides abscessus subsp. abscessus]